MHYKTFKYSERYRFGLTMALSVVFGAATVSMMMLVAMVESGTERNESEYFRLWLTGYSKLIAERQPQITQLTDRGL